MAEPKSAQGDPAVRQFVYRQEREEAIGDLAECEGVTFHLAASPLSLAGLARPLLARFGVAGFVKLALKLATKKRNLYLLRAGSRVAHFGWLNVGFCNYYQVQEGEVTIGPIWSDHSMRGRGLATGGLKRAINALFARGHRVFYIDTSEDNIAAQRAIEKAGFGEPVACYAETSSGWVPIESDDSTDGLKGVGSP